MIPGWSAADFETASLAALFGYSVLASTLLPGGSEIALFAFVQGHPDRANDALWLATLGNTLGGMITYACGRFLPKWQRLNQIPQAATLRRYGNAALLLSWVPLVGDLLCLAAGWLRNDWRSAALFMAIGKFARYALVLQGALLLA